MRGLVHRTSTLVALAVSFAGGVAHATTQTGQVLVEVKDQLGATLGNVRLELTGRNMQGKREALTTEVGEARFQNLPPGDYEVKANLEGYAEASAAEIEVQIGRTSTVSLVMTQFGGGPVAEEIVVTGALPTVDTEKTALGSSISHEFTSKVPTGRSYQSITALVPGVVDANGGGNPQIHGATLYGNQYLLDGINITDPVTNTFSANFNFDAIEAVEVLTGGRDAEYGSAVGGVINIVTKGGSNEFNIDASVYYQSNFTQLPDEFSGEQPNNQSFQANVNVGGPIIDDILWYYASVEVPFTSQQEALAGESRELFTDLQGAQHPPRQFLAVYPLAKLTWQATDDINLRLLFQADPTAISNVTQEAGYHPDAEERQNQWGYLFSLMGDFTFSEDLLLETKLAFKNNTLAIGPQSGNYDLAGHQNPTLGTFTVNDTRQHYTERNRLQAMAAINYTVPDLLGEHQFKGGVDFSYTFNKVFESIPGGRYFIDNGLDPANPNSGFGAGLPNEEVRMIEPQDTTIEGDIFSVYLQDVWKPFDNLTLRPGVRFDSARMRNFEGVTQMELNQFSPRVGAAWDPFGDHKTSIHGGYYQYVDTGFLTLSDFAGGRSALLRHYQYNPATDEYDDFLFEEGGASGVVGKQYLKDPWNQRRPRTHEFLLGVEQEVMEKLVAGADFIYRHHENQWEDNEINAIWNDAGDAVIGFKDGTQRYIYSLGAMRDAWIRYYGVELKLEKRFGNNWDMMASYTWSRTEGTLETIITVAFDRPRNRPYEFGPLPHDIQHVLKLYGSYSFPYGIVVGGRLRYQSGEPYNRKVFNSFFSDYEDFAAPRGFDRDANGKLVPLRLPDQFTLNARITWQLEELTGQKIDIIVDWTNMLNARTTVAVEERDLPAGGVTEFGDTVSRLDPMSFEFGLRYQL